MVGGIVSWCRFNEEGSTVYAYEDGKQLAIYAQDTELAPAMNVKVELHRGGDALAMLQRLGHYIPDRAWGRALQAQRQAPFYVGA